MVSKVESLFIRAARITLLTNLFILVIVFDDAKSLTRTVQITLRLAFAVCDQQASYYAKGQLAPPQKSPGNSPEILGVCGFLLAKENVKALESCGNHHTGFIMGKNIGAIPVDVDELSKGNESTLAKFNITLDNSWDNESFVPSEAGDGKKQGRGIKYPVVCSNPPPPYARTIQLHIFWNKESVSLQSDGQGNFADDTEWPKVNGFRKIAVLIHGYVNNFTTSSVYQLLHDYQKLEDVVTVLFDWGPAACHNCKFWGLGSYWFSVTNVKWVGTKLGGALIQWMNSGGAKNEQFHLIGHSLGAHVAGLAGREVKSKTNTRFLRITGLDPAHPCFEQRYISCAYQICSGLQSEDAESVDVIHTSYSFLGYRGALGTVDFYPNRGEKQPGCSPAISFPFVIDSCSHTRAVELYKDSITKKDIEFQAQECKSWKGFVNQAESECSPQYAVMGEHFNPKVHKPGVYWLKTASNASNTHIA